MMNAVEDSERQAWFAVLTKPRSEAQALQHLERQGFECFLPKVQHQRRSLRGMQQTIEALFPRYVFLRARADGWTLGPVRSTRGVAGVVRFGQKAAHVPASVIAHIRSRIHADDCVQLDVPELRVGDSVRVTEGPFSGLRAVFHSHSGSERVRLLMEILGERVAVVVPRAQLVVGFAGAWCTRAGALPA
jgi:transcriptional antiterminator RfaH